MLFQPGELQDYVIVHELLHVNVPNHGKLWKSLMRAHLGDYEALEQAYPCASPPNVGGMPDLPDPPPTRAPAALGALAAALQAVECQRIPSQPNGLSFGALAGATNTMTDQLINTVRNAVAAAVCWFCP